MFLALFFGGVGELIMACCEKYLLLMISFNTGFCWLILQSQCSWSHSHFSLGERPEPRCLIRLICGFPSSHCTDWISWSQSQLFLHLLKQKCSPGLKREEMSMERLSESSDRGERFNVLKLHLLLLLLRSGQFQRKGVFTWSLSAHVTREKLLPSLGQPFSGSRLLPSGHSYQNFASRKKDSHDFSYRAPSLGKQNYLTGTAGCQFTWWWDTGM